jgi:pimeloyl-ACP methyl ester carboxylesterase
MARPRVSRVLAGTAIGLGLAYAAVIPGLYLAQRSLIFPAPQHFPAMPAGYRQVSFTTADSLDLRAAWRPPAPGRPVVLFFHGNGDNWTGAAAANRLLAEDGYGVLLAEYRGYGGNPGEPSEEGLYADSRAALTWIEAEGFSTAQIAVVGNSIGSGPATQLAREKRVGALVLISPFASLPDVVAEKFPLLPGRWLVRDRFDNAAKLAAVTSPVLLLHGANDTMIPDAHSRRLATAAPRARFELVPGFGHELAYRDAAQQVELEWLDEVFAR